MYVIATVGQKSWPLEKIRLLLASEVRLLRYNVSRVDAGELIWRVRIAQSEISAQGLDVGIMADLTGGKWRLGRIRGFAVAVRTGQQFLFRYAQSTEDIFAFVPIDVPGLGAYLKAEMILTIADGELAFHVDSILDNNSLFGTALNDGFLVSTRGVNIEGHAPIPNESSGALHRQIGLVAPLRPHFIALSFAETRECVESVRAFVATLDPAWTPKIAAKIETEQGARNVADIAKASDMVIVGRGDLALTAPYERLGLFQKEIIRSCRLLGKEVVVATQIFGESSEYHVPIRSGIVDITNMVFEGVSGVMFGSETSYSDHPHRPVQAAHRIVKAVRESLNPE